MEDKTAPASKQEVCEEVKQGIDDLLEVLDDVMEQIDARFHENEQRIIGLQQDVVSLNSPLDNIQKSTEISEDERLVIAYQLSKIQRWAERAGHRLGIKYHV